jgi:YcaO-like protein with predicted kinase domain
MDPERERNFYWLRAFSKNLHRLAPLPAPGAAEHPVPVSPEAVAAWRSGTVPLAEIASLHSQREPLHHRTAPRETAKRLSRRLEQMGILAGWETRTEATISPFAIERPWALSIEVADGRNHWRLTGEPVSYGRGLNVHQGRIFCLMEAVERYCAFAGCREGRLEGFTGNHALVRAAYADLKSSNRPALDPNTLGLEVAYQNEPLLWISGERVGPSGAETILVPAQLVFLFANFDEICLTSGRLSNGLGAGETLAEARLSALLEVLERDADKVVPFYASRCFTLEGDDEKTADIIEGCRRKGIHIQFLDITSELGVPCIGPSSGARVGRP